MSKSLYARKSIGKITSLPNCTNMAGGGGFTGGRIQLCSVRSRYGKHQECVTCQMGTPVSATSASNPGTSFWINPGSFIMNPGELSSNGPVRARLVKGSCTTGVPCFSPPTK
jgi:hypothetical protein